MELSPVRSTLAATGWFMLLSHGAAFPVALPFVRRPALTLGLFAANAVLFGTISLLIWRYGLKRVVAPPPPEAVVVPERLATRRNVAWAALNIALVILAVTRIVTPALLGIGVGAALGQLWGAMKIKQFERDDGRRVLRRIGRRTREEPYLYAGP